MILKVSHSKKVECFEANVLKKLVLKSIIQKLSVCLKTKILEKAFKRQAIIFVKVSLNDWLPIKNVLTVFASSFWWRATHFVYNLSFCKWVWINIHYTYRN